MSKNLGAIIRYCLFMGLGIFLICWSLKGLSISDKNEIVDALKKGKLWLIVPGFLLLLFSHFVRALRWRLLIKSLGYNTTKTNVFFAVLIGYLGNQAVPRLGEVLRCSTLTRYEKIPFDKLLGTVILERIIDAITLLLFFIVALTFQPQLYQHITEVFFSKQTSSESNHWLSYLIIVCSALFIVLITLVVLIPSRSINILKKIKLFFHRICEGILAIKSLNRRWAFILLTILLWSLYLSCIFIGFLMLEETKHLGIMEAITVLCAGSVGIIATPGGIGAYAILVEKTLLLYNINNSIGLAVGWIQWLLQTSVTVISGTFSLLALPLYNKKKENTFLNEDEK